MNIHGILDDYPGRNGSRLRAEAGLASGHSGQGFGRSCVPGFIPAHRAILGSYAIMNLLKSLSAALIASAIVGAPLSVAFAQEQMSAEEIEQALKPKKLTRSLVPTAASKSKDELDGILSRSIGIVERQKIVEITQKSELPRLDFAINFGFDSAEIDSASFATLDTLAEALKSGDLTNSRFLINGHTDSKGTDEYNLALSQNRADAVVAYLVSKHEIDASRLKAIGFGETALKDANDGEDPANRRVEIINRP
jgi:outer membrane protein OmpA-like peptidoglycan-associated protein